MRLSRALPLLPLLVWPAAAQAGASFLVSPPTVENDDIVLMLGGLSEDGVTLKPTSIEVEIDGAPAGPPRVLEGLFAHAESAAQKDPHAPSPLTVGLVYLWVKEVPSAMSDALLEGVSSFCRRLPQGTQAYATLYGRKRQGVPKLKASELASDLHDVSFLSGDRPNLAEAIRLGAKTVASDDSLFKLLLVVTDGRDFADPTGEQPADFVALADELARARLPLLLVSFPAPELDAEPSARNLAALEGTGLHRAVDRPEELQGTLDSLGQVVADMRLVRLSIPWSWRTFGGSHRLRLNLMVNGKLRALDVGALTLPPGNGRWLLASAGLLAALLVLGVAWLIRARRASDQGESLLDAASELIEQGVTARRAIVNLSRRFPKKVASLASLDPAELAEAGYPALQTKAGRRRFGEMVALLKRADDAPLGEDLATALAQVMAERVPADQAAVRLAARVAEDELSWFCRLSLEQMATLLRRASERHPVLATPRSRALALAIQEVLHQPQATGRSVGWLVRAAGPGKRGETLCLGKARVVLGRSSGCDISLPEDLKLSQEHVAISESHGSFAIEPLQGPVKVEDQALLSRRPLHDGDTIEIGESRFVWKFVGR